MSDVVVVAPGGSVSSVSCASNLRFEGLCRYDETKSDEWQFAYMCMVAATCGGITRIGDYGVQNVSDGSGKVVVVDVGGRSGCQETIDNGRVNGDTGGEVDSGEATGTSGELSSGQECDSVGVACGRVQVSSGNGVRKEDICGGRASEVVVDTKVTNGADSGVSFKTLRNRQWRQDKKALKQRRQRGEFAKAAGTFGRGVLGVGRNGGKVSQGLGISDDSLGLGQQSEAQRTMEAKWVMENELALEKAKQELEILKRRDVTKEVKKREALVMKKTETSKVAVERAFGMLKVTGNVPGFCETVVSGASVPSLSNGSGSISPNSSVSEADVWRLKKELEDAKAECVRLRKEIGDDRLEKLKKDETVAYTVENFTEELEKELEEKIPGGIQTQFSNFDPSTVYVHKDRNYDEFTHAYEELF